LTSKDDHHASTNLRTEASQRHAAIHDHGTTTLLELVLEYKINNVSRTAECPSKQAHLWGEMANLVIRRRQS